MFAQVYARYLDLQCLQRLQCQDLIALAQTCVYENNLDAFEQIFPLIDGEMDGGYPVTRAYFFEYRDDSDA